MSRHLLIGALLLFVTISRAQNIPPECRTYLTTKNIDLNYGSFSLDLSAFTNADIRVTDGSPTRMEIVSPFQYNVDTTLSNNALTFNIMKQTTVVLPGDSQGNGNLNSDPFNANFAGKISPSWIIVSLSAFLLFVVGGRVNLNVFVILVAVVSLTTVWAACSEKEVITIYVDQDLVKNLKITYPTPGATVTFSVSSNIDITSNPVCSGSTCSYTLANPNYPCKANTLNCNGSTCVDVSNNNQFCGSCTVSCASPQICRNKKCIDPPKCVYPLLNCDSNIYDCETRADNSVDNCGSCGNSCINKPNSYDGSCVDGKCELQCYSYYEDCDGDTSNGCEVYTYNNVSSCGSCTNNCSSVPPPFGYYYSTTNYMCSGTYCSTSTTSNPCYDAVDTKCPSQQCLQYTINSNYSTPYQYACGTCCSGSCSSLYYSAPQNGTGLTTSSNFCTDPTATCCRISFNSYVCCGSGHSCIYDPSSVYDVCVNQTNLCKQYSGLNISCSFNSCCQTSDTGVSCCGTTPCVANPEQQNKNFAPKQCVNGCGGAYCNSGRRCFNNPDPTNTSLPYMCVNNSNFCEDVKCANGTCCSGNMPRCCNSNQTCYSNPDSLFVSSNPNVCLNSSDPCQSSPAPCSNGQQCCHTSTVKCCPTLQNCVLNPEATNSTASPSLCVSNSNPCSSVQCSPGKNCFTNPDSSKLATRPVVCLNSVDPCSENPCALAQICSFDGVNLSCA